MDTFLRVGGVQAQLFLYLLVGVLCRKKGILTDETTEKLTDLIIYITLPCMVFESFNMEFSLAILRAGAEMLLIASVMALLALGLGKLLYRRYPRDERSVLRYGMLVTNSGFVGMPLVSGAYGQEGLFLASFFIIPTRILMWSAGISLFSEADGRDNAKKVLLNPSIIAVELGLARMALQLPLPGVIDAAISGMGDCSTPLVMLQIGAMLADTPISAAFDRRAFGLAAVRQLALPLLCLAGLRLLGTEALALRVSVTLSGMPIGTTTALIARKYGANAAFASKCVFVSTLSSLVTVPLLSLLL